MAGETFLKGNTVIFSVWDGTDSYDPLACITSSTLSEEVEVDEVETKCDPGNIIKTPGSYSYEISAEGIYIDEAVDTNRSSHAVLKALLRAKTLITWRMATSLSTSGQENEYGTGYITSLELTGEAGENATFSVTISGTGSISTTDPN